MSNVFTAPQGTKVFYQKDGKTEFIEFKTGKLELENGLMIDACKRHPKVLEVENEPKVVKVKKVAKIEPKKEEKKEEPKKEEKKVNSKKRNLKSIKKD